MDDKVSIITPLYNLEPFIAACIESVLNQSYSNFEMIIIDDRSTDSGPEIVEGFARADSRVRFIKNPSNSGPARTRNRGIESAEGRYLAFLDGDDIWFPNFLEKSLETIKALKCDFVFASYKRFDENLNPLLSDFIVPDKVNYKDLLKSNPISCLTAFIDISKLDKEYMPDVKKRQDYALWLNYLKRTEYAFGIKEPLAIYRIRSNSLSRNKYSALKYQWKVYREIENLGLILSCYYIIHWGIRGFLKYRR